MVILVALKEGSSKFGLCAKTELHNLKHFGSLGLSIGSLMSLMIV